MSTGGGVWTVELTNLSGFYNHYYFHEQLRFENESYGQLI
jgi:hypothetical protein